MSIEETSRWGRVVGVGLLLWGGLTLLSSGTATAILWKLPMFDQIADESDLSPSSNLLLSGKVKELIAKPDVAANSGWFC